MNSSPRRFKILLKPSLIQTAFLCIFLELHHSGLCLPTCLVSIFQTKAPSSGEELTYNNCSAQRPAVRLHLEVPKTMSLLVIRAIFHWQLIFPRLETVSSQQSSETRCKLLITSPFAKRDSQHSFISIFMVFAGGHQLK